MSFFSSVVNDVQNTVHCISVYFHLFYLILKSLLHLFGTNVISEIGAEVKLFLGKMKKKKIGAKVM